MSRPLTIAMVAAMPFPMAKASSIRVANIVRALVSTDQDIRVKVFAYEGTEPLVAHPRVDLHLIRGFNADKAQYYSWMNKSAADAKLIRELLRFRKEIDVVHCHTIEGLGIALSFKWLAFSRAPICMDVHGPIVAELLHYKLIPNWRPVVGSVAALERFMLRRVRHAFVSNEGLKHVLTRNMAGSDVSVVFDYVDLNVFTPERIDRARVAELARRYKPNGERLITFLGMFKDYQGVDYLLRAFAVLVKRYPHLRLLLVGDGPCRTQYEEIIRSEGIAEQVVMPGLMPHKDVVNWLEISDIVCSPRVDNEITRAGFVSQLPEYMAMGKLTVATGVSGCSYLLRDAAGILVPPNDVEALSRGLEQALLLDADGRQALIAKAHENVAQFTWGQGIAEVHRVYRSLASRAA
jgi:glycosyltransferase involved in cell wall biosynthesis